MLWLIVLVCLPSFSFGRVTINYPYYPVYVQTGEELRLVCNSSQRYELQWEWKTDSSGQKNEIITPVQGGPFTIRTLSEEPSGYVESILTKTDMKVLDTGNYMCKDKGDESTYIVYVTVLHILSTNVIAEEEDSEVYLQCKIIGFTNNIPEMAVTWAYNDMLVSPESGKYAVHFDTQTGVTRLNIRNPGREDGGTYECVFALSTFLGGNFYASKIVELNADKLPAIISGVRSPNMMSSAFTLITLILSLLAAMILT